MEISQDIIAKAGEMVKNNLESYQNEISEAFIHNEEILDIALKVRFSMNKGKFKIQSYISFVPEKIKDSQTVWFDPDQPELFSIDEPPPDRGLEG